MEKPNLTQLKELPSKWRTESVRQHNLGPDERDDISEWLCLKECADELEPLLVSLLAEREAMRERLISASGLIHSAIAHVSHGGPTRADAEKWLDDTATLLEKLAGGGAQ